jgi:hypothetical protein
LKNNHLGGKSSHTTCTDSLTCNHWCCILHTNSGGPGCWNDQILVRLDQFIMGICDGNLLSNYEFNLLSEDGDRNIITMMYTGVYVIVDNGYLQWSCTVSLFDDKQT